jgi:hypothetical protein
LQSLREAFGEESVQRCFGRFESFYEPEDLWCPLHGTNSDKRNSNEVGVSLPSKKVSEGQMREMRLNRHSEHPSHGRGRNEQCTCEFDDTVWELSSEIALGEWKGNTQKAENLLHNLWQESGGERFLHEPLQALYEVWRSITDKEIGAFRRHYSKRDEHRVQKLKSLGNSIVPQVAHQIMMAIKETEKKYLEGEYVQGAAGK